MAKIKGSFEKVLEVSKPVKLIVTTGSGDIQVSRRAQDDRVLVIGRFVVRAWGREEALALVERVRTDPPVEVQGNLVKVGDLSKYRGEISRWVFGPSLVIDFEIQAPFETEAEIDSGSGDQSISGIRGPVRISAGSGDVQLHDIEQESSVKTGSGDIEIANVSQITARAGSGDVDISGARGDVDVHVGSGDVTIRDIGGALSVETGSGDIKIDSGLGAKARWRLNTGSGDVLLVLPADARFMLSARTSSGDIDIDFPITVSGKISKRELRGSVGEGPEAEIIIETSSGDIEIQKRSS